MNEGDSKGYIETFTEYGNGSSEENAVTIIQRHISDAGNVFLAAWIRYAFPTDDGTNRFLLGGRRSFLLYFRLFLVGVYFTYETLK